MFHPIFIYVFLFFCIVYFLGAYVLRGFIEYIVVPRRLDGGGKGLRSLRPRQRLLRQRFQVKTGILRKDGPTRVSNTMAVRVDFPTDRCESSEARRFRD